RRMPARRLSLRKRRTSASELLCDSRGLARQVAQVIELGAAHVAATLHLDPRDRRAVGLEHALHTLAMADLAHGERGVEAAIADRDHHTLVGLHALAVAFDHLHLHDYGVPRTECRDLAGHAALFNLLNDVGHVVLP